MQRHRTHAGDGGDVHDCTVTTACHATTECKRGNVSTALIDAHDFVPGRHGQCLGRQRNLNHAGAVHEHFDWTKRLLDGRCTSFHCQLIGDVCDPGVALDLISYRLGR